jgi:DNA (cytosine-5)-methyltransferase 1
LKKIKILNLYAFLGGNRYKWNEVYKNIEVTSVELDPELAKLYQERFPEDKVIIADAHQFLLDHFFEFDFIWSSPPCPSHSRARFWSSSNLQSATKPIYPDMKLYEEILFLEHYFPGKYCIENVIPYYKPFCDYQKRGRHLYWTNFKLPQVLSQRKWKDKDDMNAFCDFHDFDFYKYKGDQRRDKIARNLVDYEAGKAIFSTAMNIQLSSKDNQINLFEVSKNTETLQDCTTCNWMNLKECLSPDQCKNNS